GALVYASGPVLGSANRLLPQAQCYQQAITLSNCLSTALCAPAGSALQTEMDAFLDSARYQPGTAYIMEGEGVPAGLPGAGYGTVTLALTKWAKGEEILPLLLNPADPAFAQKQAAWAAETAQDYTLETALTVTQGGESNTYREVYTRLYRAACRYALYDATQPDGCGTALYWQPQPDGTAWYYDPACTTPADVSGCRVWLLPGEKTTACYQRQGSAEGEVAPAP
ncbi:MAG: hypothetical protein PHO10_00615, partial [Gemmiger sp.]|nr:hypothetical protein [Gemmiger sp.]